MSDAYHAVVCHAEHSDASASSPSQALASQESRLASNLLNNSRTVTSSFCHSVCHDTKGLRIISVTPRPSVVCHATKSVGINVGINVYLSRHKRVRDKLY